MVMPGAAPSGAAPGVAVDSVSVHYGPIRAVDAVTLHFQPAVVHGLVGHNGSGKSTLVRVLAGAETPTRGRVHWDGSPLGPGHCLPAVHQTLGLVEDLTALENYGVTSGFGKGRLISWRDERRRFSAHRERIGVDVDPRRPVRELSPSQRAGVAVMRCLRTLDERPASSQFIIFDEVTAYFDSTERTRLAALVDSVVAAGIGVIFISHYLEEVLRICSAVTVLRSGQVAGTFDTASLDKGSLSEVMFGSQRDLGSHGASRSTQAVEERLSLRPFLDADLGPGEILGVTGRSGGPQEGLPYELATAIRSSRDRLTKVALVPSERARRGVWLNGSISENLTLPSLARFRRRARPLLSTRAERRFTSDWLSTTNFRVSGPDAKLSELSGGMQQKVVVARALITEPDLLVLHEPTQGIDISARADIMRAIVQAADRGTAVLIVSSEYDELSALCDRVIVVRDDSHPVVLQGVGVSEPAIAAAI